MSITRAFILHPDIRHGGAMRSAEARLAEAVALAHALPETEVAGAQVVRLDKPVPGWLFGSGKRAELKEQFHDSNTDLVLIDGPVTPVQQRNLEKEWGLKLLDRTGLILEIFSDRAATREGVLQVEMAALAYQRTRLVRAWTHLERQRGGLGFVGGPGETQIEADRRAIDEALVRLRRQLSKVVKTRELHRSARAKVPYPIVALVGYTNAGKSTLFNILSKADVLAKDMLFATLDPTMRAVRIEGAGDVILSDTVGFVSDLPTELVAAFRATLEEVLAADLILHVRDISHPDSAAQASDVEKILEDLGASSDVARLELWNKLDRLDPVARAEAEARAARDPGILTLSAVTGEGLPELGRAIGDALARDHREMTLDLGWEEGEARAYLHREGAVQAERANEGGLTLDLRLSDRQLAKLQKLRASD